MSTCMNCKSALSCGCQRRTASDGKAVCSTCLLSYEASLKTKTQPVQTDYTKEPNNIDELKKYTQ